MNRTAVFLGLAGGLCLLAVVVGVPRTPWANRGSGGGTHIETPIDVTPPPPPAVVTDGSIRMEARLSHPYIATGSSDLFLTVDLTGVDVPGATRAPVNLGLVIDRSGSMAGEKLMQAKNAARQLIQQLRDEDRLAIIHYGSDVRTFAGGHATSSNKERMLAYVNGIFDEGGTNIGDGLTAGKHEVLKAANQFKVNRIILISDGQPTEGITNHQQLLGIARDVRAQGVTISSIGVGTDFNEDLMQDIAEQGSGAYAYLHEASQLAAIFQKDLQQASTTIARNVELRLNLPAGAQLGEVLGYRSHADGAGVRVPLADFSAGQVERVVFRVRVDGREVGKAVDVAGLSLDYTDLLKNTQARSSAQLSAMVTDRQEEVAKNQNKEATVYAARAQSAANLNNAAESLRRGDKAAAQKYIQANEMLFEGAAQVAGPAAVQADMDDQKTVWREMESAQSTEEVEHQVKSAKKRARMSSGKMSSTY